MAMGKFIKPGKIVVILQGRQAGKKAIVVKNYDEGTSARRFGHCLVAGVQRPPKKIKRKMSKKKITKKLRIKPFVQYINYQHIMPTRYSASDLQTKELVTPDQMETPDGRLEAKRLVRKVLEEKFQAVDCKLKYLRTKLRF